jgi:hypothetical protein
MEERGREGERERDRDEGSGGGKNESFNKISSSIKKVTFLHFVLKIVPVRVKTRKHYHSPSKIWICKQAITIIQSEVVCFILITSQRSLYKHIESLGEIK